MKNLKLIQLILKKFNKTTKLFSLSNIINPKENTKHVKVIKNIIFTLIFF